MNFKQILTALVLTLPLAGAMAEGTTAFTYQGRLDEAGVPANGLYDLRFAVYDALTGPSQVGAAVTNSGTAVTNGLFVVALDFGGSVFNGNARWLELAVRTNGGGAFIPLTPRQPLTPAPYALYAPSAGAAATAATVPDGAITSAKLGDGAVGSVQLAAGAVTSAKIAQGTITDGHIGTNGLTGDKIIGGDLQAQRLKVGMNHTLVGPMATIAGGFQNTISNAGWSVDAIGGGQENRIQGAGHGTIAGGYQNQITNGAWVATVAGGAGNVALGGTAVTIGGGQNNTVSNWAATVSGGSGNSAVGSAAAVGGGMSNSNNGWCGTIPGGRSNVVTGDYSLAAGNRAKALHNGAFVWSDAQETDFATTTTNQFLVRASGGVGIGTNNPQSALHVAGTVTADAFNTVGAAGNEPPSGVTPILNMVWIKPGTFVMGSPASEVGRNSDEGPQTVVTLTKGFWMGHHEVTQGEYQSLMNTNPSSYSGDLSLPVETVSWIDATNFCWVLTQREQVAGRLPAGWVYRLPTEAEWEYCCRSLTTTRFYYGDDPGYTSLTNYAWYGLKCFRP